MTRTRSPQLASVHRIAELELIRQIIGATSTRLGVDVGNGDDAAILSAGGRIVASVDMLVEGVHFRRSTASLADIGHRALAASLSDLAAMGADGVAALIALGIPHDVSVADVRALYVGIEALAAATGVTVAGGDVSAAPALTISVTALGRVPDGRASPLRSGAVVGDGVFVTGPLGGSAAGLAILEGQVPRAVTAAADHLVLAHRRPQPRLGEGARLAAAGAHAMLDCTDGLALDLERMAIASGVHITLDLALIPIADGVKEVATALGTDPATFAATGGEDFELIVAAPDSLCPDMVRVGRVVDGPAALTITRAGAVQALPSLGYKHAIRSSDHG